MRVLVLDDQPDVALLRVLRSTGAISLVARTEEEAIIIINAGIDAAIVDMQIEANWRYGGITVIRYLRERLGGNLPVILFTGHLDEGARRECEHLNARYVVKPGPTTGSLVDYLRENQPAPKRTHLGSERRTDDEDATPNAHARTSAPAARRLDLSNVVKIISAGGPHARRSGLIDVAREKLYDEAIAQAAGNITKAGQLLGVSRQAVQNYLARRRGR